MKNSAPLILAMIGFTMLLLVLPEGVVLSLLAAIEGRRPEEIRGQAGTVSLAMALLGLLAMVGGGARYAFLRRRALVWGPYESALTRLAMEHGQGVFAQPGGGIGFRSAREGHDLEVLTIPGNPPMLIVRQAVPARQPLVFVHADDAPPAAQAHFKQAGAGRSWKLLAELPALARAHMNDMGVVQRMDRFFDLAESRWVAHDANGIEVVCNLPPQQLVGQRAREALDVLGYLRQVNG